MKLADELRRVGTPGPWSFAERNDRRGPYWTLIDADGQDTNEHTYKSMDDARLAAVVNAFGPRALAYVEQAATKGGAEAQTIMSDFWKAVRPAA